jgi:hypothetical protein
VPDIIEVEIRLADTTIEMTNVTAGTYRVVGLEIEAAGVLRHGGGQLAIGSAWVRHQTGVVEVRARRAQSPRRHPLHRSRVDPRPLGYVVASLAVHLFVWAMAADQPVERIEPEPPVARYGTHVRSIGTTSVSSALPWDVGDSPDFALPGGGQPMAGAEAKAGGASPREAGHALIERREQPRVTREMAIEAAHNAGILGASAIKSGGFAASVGSMNPASGFDTKDIQGPLYGGVGEAGGSFGLGRSGLGNSAGCQGENCNGVIGVGRYGTISNGQSVGDHWGGRRLGASSLRREPRLTITFCAGPLPCVVGIGGLDKAIIRRHVRRQLAKFEYCYEKELLASPELAGTVETDFLINADGSVAEVQARGVSLEVASCVAGVIKSIEFPRWAEGSTQVKYPFTFRPAGT